MGTIAVIAAIALALILVIAAARTWSRLIDLEDEVYALTIVMGEFAEGRTDVKKENERNPPKA